MNKRFYVNPLTYKRFYERMLGIDTDAFINCMKEYLVYSIGENAHGSQKNIVRDIRHFV